MAKIQNSWISMRIPNLSFSIGRSLMNIARLLIELILTLKRGFLLPEAKMDLSKFGLMKKNLSERSDSLKKSKQFDS